MIHHSIKLLNNKNKSIYRVIWIVQRYFNIRDTSKWSLNIGTNLKYYHTLYSILNTYRYNNFNL